MAGDPFNLDRFVAAQAGGIYEQALAELRDGCKRSHWMWFIFPQHRDLGRSETAQFYGLSGVDEARAYAAHPLLGERLRQSARAILPHLASIPPEAILGPIDALKLRSSLAIFAQAMPEELLFADVLAAANRPIMGAPSADKR
jgi:uncharacterized protein (DUF1810 family)